MSLCPPAALRASPPSVRIPLSTALRAALPSSACVAGGGGEGGAGGGAAKARRRWASVRIGLGCVVGVVAGRAGLGAGLHLVVAWRRRRSISSSSTTSAALWVW